jgi:hypothetical protein
MFWEPSKESVRYFFKKKNFFFFEGIIEPLGGGVARLSLKTKDYVCLSLNNCDFHLVGN